MKTTYMLTSAMLLALAAPAYAQQVPPTTITQTTTGYTYLGDGGLIGPGPFFPGAGNSADVTGNGPVVTSVVGQTNNTVLNAVGQQAYVGVGSPFAITQGAGTYSIGGGAIRHIRRDGRNAQARLDHF